MQEKPLKPYKLLCNQALTANKTIQPVKGWNGEIMSNYLPVKRMQIVRAAFNSMHQIQ